MVTDDRDPGDECHRAADFDGECAMCGRGLDMYVPREERYEIGAIRVWKVPLLMRAADIPDGDCSKAMCEILTVHNRTMCVQQAFDFQDAQRARVRRELRRFL